MEKKKGGRPTKGTATKKSKRIVFWTTEAEAASIKEKASQMGVTVSEYCESVVSQSQLIAPFTEEELALKCGLVGMANNLNQLAFRANAAGIHSVESSARDLFTELKKLLEKYR